MNIRFVSSLTPEDENHLAPALITVLTAILDLLSLPYMLRIDTADAKVYEHCRPGVVEAPSPSRGQVVPLRAVEPREPRS